MKYKVEALDTYVKNDIIDNELKRVPAEGEQWDVSNDRLNVLLGENEHNLVFVKVIENKEDKANSKKEIEKFKNKKGETNEKNDKN